MTLDPFCALFDGVGSAWGPHGLQSRPLEENWRSRPLVSGKRLQALVSLATAFSAAHTPLAGHGPGSAKAGPGQTEAFEQRNPLPP